MALILLAAALTLAPAATAHYEFYGFVTVYFAAAAAWLPLVRKGLPLAVTIVVAVVFRLLFFVPEPRLSGDVYRYLSDGAEVARGENPYAYAPSDPRINHPEIRSIYPPAAQLLFGAVHHLTGWRLLILTTDIAVVFLLRNRGALAYATCPLVIVEGTWSGHVDVIAGGLLALALTRRSGLAAGLAAGLKVIPVAAFPALLRISSSRSRFVAAFIAALAVPAIPFLAGPLMPGIRDYATRWIFNSPLYDLVRAGVETIPTKAIWTIHPFRFESISDFVYPYLYADFLTRAVLAVLAVAAIASVRHVTTAVAALLMFSPAIHPWYWLILVPAALIERSRWLYVALIAPISYLLYEGAPVTAVYVWMIAVAFAVMPRRVALWDAGVWWHARSA